MIVSKLLFFRYFSTQVVITILNSDVCRTICKMDIHVTCYVESLRSWLVWWLVWNPSWFHWLPGLWEFGYVKATALVGVFYSWSLVNWAVLLQLVLKQCSTLNLSYVYLKQKFLFHRISFWQLIAIIDIGVFKSKKVLPEYASGHFLYAQIRTFRCLI